MLNFLLDQELPEQISNTFIWFINQGSKLWRDYFNELYVLSDEEGQLLTDQLPEKRKALIEEGIKSFPNKEYVKLVETLLTTLDKDLEKANFFSLYPDYHLDSINASLDCYSTVGAHSYIDTLIFDAIEDINRDVILDKYKPFLDKQANALLEYEDEVEMLWDNVYYFVIGDEPRLYYFSDLIERKR